MCGRSKRSVVPVNGICLCGVLRRLPSCKCGAACSTGHDFSAAESQPWSSGRTVSLAWFHACVLLRWSHDDAPRSGQRMAQNDRAGCCLSVQEFRRSQRWGSHLDLISPPGIRCQSQELSTAGAYGAWFDGDDLRQASVSVRQEVS